MITTSIFKSRFATLLLAIDHRLIGSVATFSKSVSQTAITLKERGVNNIYKKIKTYKTERKIMEKQSISSSSVLGVENSEKIMGIANAEAESAECMIYENHFQNVGCRIHCLNLEEKCIDLGNITSASKINNNHLGKERQLTSGKQQPMIFYFDLETSGLEVGCDILQISVRSGDSHFFSFVTPTKPIDIAASQVNNLYFRDGDLYQGYKRVDTMPLDKVLEGMIDYLATLSNKCVLVAHNCPFDARHLLSKLRKNPKLFDRFKALIYGFVDSLEMFRDKYPERRWTKGALTLTRLVEESLGESPAGAHDATIDTYLLERLVHHHFNEELILHYRNTLTYVLKDRKYWSTPKKFETQRK